MFFEIVSAEYLNGYKISIHFKDGKSGIVDLSDYVDPTNVFKKFLDVEYFTNCSVEYGTLTWGQGELDIAPEHLYELATGEKVNLVENETVGSQ